MYSSCPIHTVVLKIPHGKYQQFCDARFLIPQRLGPKLQYTSPSLLLRDFQENGIWGFWGRILEDNIEMFWNQVPFCGTDPCDPDGGIILKARCRLSLSGVILSSRAHVKLGVVLSARNGGPWSSCVQLTL